MIREAETWSPFHCIPSAHHPTCVAGNGASHYTKGGGAGCLILCMPSHEKNDTFLFGQTDDF